MLELPELATDPRFASNDARVQNRTELVRKITQRLMQHERGYWLDQFRGHG